MRGMAYFPLGGTLIGIFVSTVYDMARSFLGLPSFVAACFSKAASLWVTGCFHEDGLADSADGFGGGWSRDQILKIMQDTRLGTYGAAVLFLYVVTKLDILASLGSSSWRLWCCEGAGPALVVA
jgi:adenosylcobinamide-GDP ribazoletransferase